MSARNVAVVRAMNEAFNAGERGPISVQGHVPRWATPPATPDLRKLTVSVPRRT